VDLNAAGEFTKTVGFPIITVMALAYMIVRRRRMNGVYHSSYLVPGWVHDNLIAENEELRSTFITETLADKIECEKRIAEYRELYEAERDRRKDLDERFKLVNKTQEELVGTIKQQQQLEDELRREIAESRRRRKVPNAPA
jgi:hypothetical protein